MESPYATAPLNLDPSTPQFRLLELHPRTSSSTISCTLSSYSFDGRHPAYKALSYTWGPKAKPHLILLNGIEFHVGHNLWTFLDQMCLQGQYGVYWVDAICIDQDNTLEKNHQVQMMRRIYSTAENVVVWLGEANHDEMSDTAMDLLAGSRSWAEIGIPCPPDYFFDPKIKSVRSILNRDYWNRIWIIQEIMVAKRISIYCGSKSLEWQTLTDFMNFLFSELVESWEEDEVRAYCVYSTRAKQLVYDKWQARTIQKRWTLAELLNDYRFWEASNILDKVYALCGLASDADNVVIDYDLSPKDVVVHFLDKDPRDWDRLAWRAYLALGHASKEGFEELLNSMESPRDHIVRK